MNNKDLKKYFEIQVNTREIPSADVFFETGGIDDGKKAKPRWIINLTFHGALAAAIILLIAASLLYKTSYEETFFRMCINNRCKFNIEKQIYKMHRYLDKVKKHLNEEV